MKRSFEQAIFSFSFGDNTTILNPYAKDKVFECKTCYKQFASFQALGGHRASHKKPRIEGDENSKPKMHACPICGLEFAIGQALGGHMRRHRPIHPGQKQLKVKKGFGFDLNEPALAEAEEEIGEDDCCRQIGPTFDFMGIGPITVDCIV